MSKLIEQVYEAGIVGAGGAGFPTHIKMKGNIKTLIINGVECEPLLQVDKSLMTTYGEELIMGLANIMSELNIDNGIIAIKNKYQYIVDKMTQIAEKYNNITIKAVPNIYPVGDEVVLIYETTGIVIKKGELPIQSNLMVMNIETLLNVCNKLVSGQNVTHSFVTIIGEVNNPGTYKLPIGIEVDYILKHLTPPTIDEYKIVVGGPMTGRLLDDNEVIAKNTKALIVLNKNHPLIRNMDEVNETHLKRIMASCSQCRACTDMCPRHLLGHQVEPHKLMNAMANGLTENVDVLRTALGCVSCGVCELYACHHDLSPRKMMMAVKKAYAIEGVRASAEGCKSPHNDREYRKVPSKRLIMHLNLSRYDKPVKFFEESINALKVKIPMSQHIGAPAVPMVITGQLVKENQLIGKALKGSLSANIHSSLTGKVVAVTTDYIEIVRT